MHLLCSLLLLLAMAPDEDRITREHSDLSDAAIASPHHDVVVARAGQRLVSWNSLTGDAAELPRLDCTGRPAFDPRDGTIWAPTRGGRLVQLDVEQGREVSSTRLGLNGVDSIQVALNGAIAWVDDDLGIGGIFDPETMTNLARFSPVANRKHDGPRRTSVWLSEDGSRAGVASGRDYVIWDVDQAAEIARVRPYMGHRTRGAVFAGNELVYGSRRDGYAIRAWRPARDEVVDADPKRGHFIDLLVDPTGRWIAEGDFEDDGTTLYDRDGAIPPRLLDAGTPVGFSRDGTLVFVRPGGGGLEAWSTGTGALAHREPDFDGRRVYHVEVTQSGALAVSWWTTHDAAGGARRSTLSAATLRPIP